MAIAKKNAKNVPSGHVVLLQIPLQCRQLPRTAPSDDVLLGEARGENAQHHLVMQSQGAVELLKSCRWAPCLSSKSSLFSGLARLAPYLLIIHQSQVNRHQEISGADMLLDFT